MEMGMRSHSALFLLSRIACASRRSSAVTLRGEVIAADVVRYRAILRLALYAQGSSFKPSNSEECMIKRSHALVLAAVFAESIDLKVWGQREQG